MEFLDSQTQPKKQPTHENQTQPKKFTMLCQWHGVGSESMVALRAMRVRLSGVREEVSGRVKVILIIITLRKWVSSIGIFYSCFSNEELQLQRVSWRSRSRRRVLSCFGLKFELVSGGVYHGGIGKWCYASNVAMQAMWLCNLNFSDHQLVYTNLILQYTTQVLSLSLSQVHLYSLFQIWVVLAQIWVQGPPPRWHALTGFDGAAACWSLLLCSL